MIEAIVIASVLVLFRVAAFIAFLPPMAGQGLPNTVKIGLAVALTALLAPQYAGLAAFQFQTVGGNEFGWLQLAVLAVRETVLGAGLAWLMGLCMVPVKIAGAYVAQEIGLTLGQLTSPMDQQPTNILSQVLEGIAVLMFFALNIHHIMFFVLGRSFFTRPLMEPWSMPSWDSVLTHVSRAESNGFLIIAPVGILLFVTVLTLVVTMRTAPQFNYMTYGMPLRIVVGTLGFALFLPDICAAIRHFLYQTGLEGWA